MRPNNYNIFENNVGFDFSFCSLLLRTSMLLPLMLFVHSTAVFGQEKPQNQEAEKRIKLERKINLADLLESEERRNTPEKAKTSGKMTNKRLQEILTLESKKISGQLGNWRADYKGIPVFVISDQKANRMRIISPIIEENKLTVADLKTLLEANFDKALDAKYSIYQEILWSTYAHPLGELTDAQFKDALNQVFNLTRNYGTTYSSTGIIFGATPEPVEKQYN